MEDVYIVEAVRSPIGKFLGSLSAIQAPMLGAQVVKGLLSKTGVGAKTIDEVIVGNVLSSGLGQNPAKQVVIYSDMPATIPAYSVNMVCASSLKAVSLAAEAISSGNADTIVAGGIESMSNAPFSVSGTRHIHKMGSISLESFFQAASDAKADLSSLEFKDEMINAGLWDCYSDLHMGSLAEYLANDYKITREEEDAFALESHRRAAYAEDNGKFSDETIPIETPNGTVTKNEGIRRDTSLEKLSELKPAFEKDGIVTAGNSSQLSDGASFVLLMSGKKLKESGLEPLAKVEAYSESGIDPKMYGMAPVSAVDRITKKTGIKLSDIDLIELNEAFCVQALSVAKAMGIDRERLNVNGGATALGHPIGATGARILTTLVHALKDRKEELGLATLCHGGGGAAAMLVRRV